MAMSPKVFQTLFRITAQWKGQAAVAAAQAGMGRVGRAAQTATVKVKGLTGAVFRGNLAERAFSRALGLAVQGLTKSITAAEEAQEAHDDLGLAMERNARFYKELAGKSGPELNKILQANQDALIALAEKMEKTGHDAETLEAGWAKMLDAMAFSPEQMKLNAKAFSDVLSFMYGANATAEESIQLGEEWTATINQGSPAFLRRIKAERSYMNLLRKINKEERKGVITAEEAIKRRQRLSIRAAERVAGETEKVFARRSGKVAHMWTSIGNLFENMGKPFIARSGEIAESIDKISVGLGPTSEKLAIISETYLKDIANWVTENKDSIPGWIERIGTALEMTLKPLTTTYWLLKKLYDLGEKMKLPAAAPGASAATSSTAQAALPWRYGGTTKESPYLAIAPEPEAKKAEAAAKQAEAVQKSFYEEGYPSTAPPKIDAAAAAGNAAANAGISPNLLNKVKQLEGYYEKAYWDYKQYSIGYGTRGSKGQTTTREQAERDLTTELAMHQRNVDRAAAAVGLKLTPGQRDALTSFDFNTGAATRLIMSSGGNIENIAKRLPSWNKAGGEVNQGLVKRRAAEMEMFNAPSLKGATSALGPRAGGGGGTTNNNMSAPITINGVAAGREYAVGRQVRSAIQTPMREFLDQIKKARNYESRLGYV